MEFSQFCACGPSGYAQLKQKVDACARLGRSYEFAQCALPAGCNPDRVQVGFWRTGEDYLIYFRPAVAYGGTDSKLNEFFLRGAVQRYAGFQAMTDCLSHLNNASAAPPNLFQTLKGELQNRVLGQEQAVEAAAFKLWSYICKREPLRPLSLIFYGPTGVGKSELGKAIAPALNQCLGEERFRLVWTELNTFTQAHSTYRLTGAPPGYVGYDDPPVLEAVRHCSHTVFMFDELDKAHPEVLKVFMSILDEGRCTARQEDEQGSRELDFRRCIFLFTTNTNLSERAHRLGFALPESGAPPSPSTSTFPFPSPSSFPSSPFPASPSPSSPLPSSATLAQRLYQADESARLALARSGVLREIAGRFSGLIGFRPLDGSARVQVTAKQISALGREYGLDISHVSPAIVQALTPWQAISPRSVVPMLEGVLTPIFLTHTPAPQEGALRLEGTLEHMYLTPA